MMYMKNSMVWLVALSLWVGMVSAQETHRFTTDVETIKAFDRIYAPTKEPIVFVGSSSIRRWSDLQVAFGALNVMNRGIGGAVTDDITHYLDELVADYAPRQVVLYVGENDLPKQTAEAVLDKTKTLFHAIRERLPEVPIVYIAIKPSPVREQFVPKAREANQLIKALVEQDGNAVFVDIFNPMLTPEGKCRPELFVSDMLHMNDAGYAIWEAAIAPYLLPGE